VCNPRIVYFDVPVSVRLCLEAMMLNPTHADVETLMLRLSTSVDQNGAKVLGMNRWQYCFGLRCAHISLKFLFRVSRVRNSSGSSAIQGSKQDPRARPAGRVRGHGFQLFAAGRSVRPPHSILPSLQGGSADGTGSINAKRLSDVRPIMSLPSSWPQSCVPWCRC
jgi:hypothetical protein